MAGSGTPTTNWGISKFTGADPIAPIRNLFNAHADDLETALNNASKGFYLQFETKADLDAFSTTGLRVGQHATVYGDSTALNNGDYEWDGTIWQLVNATYGGSVKRSSSTVTLGASWNVLNTSSWWQVDQPASGLDAFSGKWVAPIDGVYDVELQISATSTGVLIAGIQKNSASPGTGRIVGQSAQGTASLAIANMHRKVRLSANDYILAVAYSSASVAWSTAADDSFFAIRYVEPLR